VILMKTCIAISPTKARFAPLFCAGDLRQGMELAARTGYDGVELNLRDSAALDQDAVVAWAQELGLKVPSFGTGQSYFTDGLSLADVRPDVQEAIGERMRGHVRFAARVGARVVLGSVRGKLDDSSPEARSASYAVAVSAVRRLASYAAECGVGLTVEPINRYETNFLNTLAETSSFIRDVGAPNIGITADTFHMNIEEGSMTDSLVESGRLLWHLHLVDSNRRAAGMGHIDFASICSALARMGYDGWLSAEVVPWPDDETAARTWMQTARTLMRAQTQVG
jgi:5-keto-L-gluconate epimerase